MNSVPEVSHISKFSLRKIQRDVLNVIVNPPNGWIINLDNEKLTQLKFVFDGPIGTSYAGGRFMGKIDIPLNYPHEPPSITFRTKIFHMNIMNEQKVDVEPGWQPSYNIHDYLKFIKELFRNPCVELPVDAFRLKMFTGTRRRRGYFGIARGYTARYANSDMEEVNRFMENVD